MLKGQGKDAAAGIDPLEVVEHGIWQGASASIRIGGVP
jgi:hypothetical protein